MEAELEMIFQGQLQIITVLQLAGEYTCIITNGAGTVTSNTSPLLQVQPARSAPTFIAYTENVALRAICKSLYNTGARDLINGNWTEIIFLAQQDLLTIRQYQATIPAT
jgi:hypothetical protein